MEAPVLETERLILRGRTMADFPAYRAMLGDIDVMRGIGGKALSEQEAWFRFARQVGFWALKGYGCWVVEEKASGKFLGDVGVAEFKRDIEPSLIGKPEFAWVLVADAHGKGYATEAARAALGWADEKFPGATMCCIIDIKNAGSIRVAEKLGFQEAVRTRYQGDDVIVFERSAT